MKAQDEGKGEEGDQDKEWKEGKGVEVLWTVRAAFILLTSQTV